MRNHSDLSTSSGFTLVEIIIVIAIVAILAAIAIPQFMQYKQTTANAALLSDANNSFIAATAYLSNPQNIIVDSEAKINEGGFGLSPNVNFISADLEITAGTIVLTSDEAETALSRAVINHVGEITLGPPVP